MTGCGSGDGEAIGSKPVVVQRANGCKPIRQELAPTPRNKRIRLGENIRLAASSLKFGPGSVTIKPRRLVVARELIVSSSEDGRQKQVTFSSPGNEFVGVVFAARNGTRSLVPAGAFGTTFRLLASHAAYAPVNATEGCAGASPAMAVSRGLPTALRGTLVGPGFLLKQGVSEQTVVVYTLPKKSRPSKWFSPLFEVTVDVSR